MSELAHRRLRRGVLPDDYLMLQRSSSAVSGLSADADRPCHMVEPGAREDAPPYFLVSHEGALGRLAGPLRECLEMRVTATIYLERRPKCAANPMLPAPGQGAGVADASRIRALKIPLRFPCPSLL